MDGPVQFIAGAQPGTVVASTNPRPGRGKRRPDGSVALVPHTPEEQAAIAQLQGVVPALHAAAWPEVLAADLFAEYEGEIADRPEKLKDLRSLKGKFMQRFATMPSRGRPSATSSMRPIGARPGAPGATGSTRCAACIATR